MAISDRTRKILWARSGNRCARCRADLVRADEATDEESIVGDECHIVAQSPIGPRGGEIHADDIDELENLILLCKSDHKQIDDLPAAFPSEELRRIKADHESWVNEKLSVASDPATREQDALGAIEQRLARIEFIQESLLPPRYLLLALDLLRPIGATELGHFRALLEVRAHDSGDSRALCVGGRDAYPEYRKSERSTLLFGQLLLSWTEPPRQLRQSTQMSECQLEVPQIVFESVADDVPEFSALSQMPHLDASVFLTVHLWEQVSRISIVASDYVIASYTREELAALSGSPTGDWPTELHAAELAVPWRAVMPKGPDWARHEREGESPDWFPANLYRPWLLDTTVDTPARIRRRRGRV